MADLALSTLMLWEGTMLPFESDEQKGYRGTINFSSNLRQRECDMAFGKQSTRTSSRKTYEIDELLQRECSFVEPLRALMENDLMTENSGTK